MKFGAKSGVGVGLTGSCYALPTKGYNLEVLLPPAIKVGIMNMLETARSHPNKWFLVTKIGCGLVGYSVDEIARLWAGLSIPPNVILPREFSVTQK